MSILRVGIAGFRVVGSRRKDCIGRDDRGLKVMHGFNHWYRESVQDALKILRSGELGDVINMRGMYGKAR